MAPLTERFVAAIKGYAERDGIEIVSFRRGERKDDRTREHLRRWTGGEGVLYIGQAQEKARVRRTERRDPRTGELSVAGDIEGDGQAPIAPRTIRETLGHSRIGLTMNAYAHAMPALSRRAAEKIARDPLGRDGPRLTAHVTAWGNDIGGCGRMSAESLVAEAPIDRVFLTRAEADGTPSTGSAS